MDDIDKLEMQIEQDKKMNTLENDINSQFGTYYCAPKNSNECFIRALMCATFDNLIELENYLNFFEINTPSLAKQLLEQDKQYRCWAANIVMEQVVLNQNECKIAVNNILNKFQYYDTFDKVNILFLFCYFIFFLYFFFYFFFLRILIKKELRFYADILEKREEI